MELDILEKVKSLENPIQFIDYIDMLLNQDYRNKHAIIPVLNDMYQLFPDPSLFVPIMLTFMLDLDRNKVYSFVLSCVDLQQTLFSDLLHSEHYMHRLALAEILEQKERTNSDIDIVRVLLDDEIEIVVKAALKCIDDKFSQTCIVYYLDKLSKSSYLLESACVRLVKYLQDVTLRTSYITLFAKSENWAVRYNLMDVIYNVDLPEAMRTEIYLGLATDKIEEVQIKFISTLSCIENADLRYLVISEILGKSGNKVKLSLLNYLYDICTEKKDLEMRYFTHLLTILNENNVDLKIKACEILCITAQNNPSATDNITSSIQDSELCKTSNLYEINHSKILGCFDELIISGNWRVRIKVLDIIEKFDADFTFFIMKLKLFLFRFLCDKVEEIRVRAKNIFIKYNNKFDGRLYEECYDDIKLLVLSKKYHVRLIGADIVKNVNQVDSITEVKYRELYNFLINDNVDIVQDFMCNN